MTNDIVIQKNRGQLFLFLPRDTYEISWAWRVLESSQRNLGFA